MAELNRTLRALLVTLLVCAAAIPLATSTLSSPSPLDSDVVHDAPLGRTLDQVGSELDDARLVRRFVNATELAACKDLDKLDKKDKRSQVFFPLSFEYGDGKSHYMASSAQPSACVYRPKTAEDLAAAVKLVGEQRVRFAVSSGGHASNQGFSSTKGIHITLRGFDEVSVAADRSYVDLGGGKKWDEVYKQLDGTGLNVVGGRVPGVGVGGFITGGGGYSWLTNQHGLTGDTLIQADMVLPDGTLATASETQHPDLFWAIRGGGNQFGIVYRYRLKAYAQSAKIYGGTRIYSVDQLPALVNATYDFSENNKDPKAQVITTLNHVGLVGPGAILLAIYDGDPGSTNPFAAFDKVPSQKLLGDFKTQSFNDAISGVPSGLQAGHRGLFHSVMFQRYSKPLLDQIQNQTLFWGKKGLLRSQTLVSYDIEPFLSFKDKTKDAAWPHSNDALPLNLYAAWDNPADDAFWHSAMKESARVLADQARAEGQKVDDLWLYPNYLIADTPVEKIFGPNLGRLRQVKRKYDPNGVMRLAGYFDF
ncbi:uncharacterized protein PFL1_06377 [Pseudozyma flocculosa PF-1]|uniref:Related to 6-hydroxy-D-nicotine oxidase n=2 Tax=Pseudozyma flocculosa TaxID=84751 RepID=A0A5C3F7P9_9BASI|nr:uncharacterized protein PFL1_06377 [Pseudozyma flocculosa PF-1]EPQ26170.1 hypothetical protein PFL1_06377 [Pseudozyma flocculosa PF-1]SPO40422.1 related to 6-hydroxy-D-nicotine oxidase [Pseudozyma flocculosa]